MCIKDSYCKSWEKLIWNKESRTSVLSLFEPENYEKKIVWHYYNEWAIIFFSLCSRKCIKDWTFNNRKSGTKNVSTALWFVNIKNTSNKSPLHNYWRSTLIFTLFKKCGEQCQKKWNDLRHGAHCQNGPDPFYLILV